MLDGTLFFVKSAEYRNRGKDVFPDFIFCCTIPLIVDSMSYKL